MVNEAALGAQTEGWRGWAVLQAAQLSASAGPFPLTGWVSLGTRPLAPCPGRVRQWGGGPTVNRQPASHCSLGFYTLPCAWRHQGQSCPVHSVCSPADLEGRSLEPELGLAIEGTHCFL